ncbi:type II secretion system F family protein [Aquipuribacter hungaricus]|uniref:Type II secretion system F family protein n=1 Tax=Aquipuribacter hungaricus TaxID=545624 RepID=A0ABV7WL40_9MICO
MSDVVLGGLLGAALAVGLLLVLTSVPRWRQVDLVDRLEPYLRDTRPSRLLTDLPGRRARLGTLERLLAPVMSDGVRWVERISGGPGTVRRRLEQSGTGTTVEQFRAEQVVWGVLGLAGGAGAAAAVGAARGPAVLPMVAVVVIGGLLGVLGRDQYLSRQVSRREERMMQEFPTVAELLALSVGAGEGAVGALERVARTCQGELSVELRRTLAAARAGASLVQALEGLAARTSLPPLARFVDGVAVAVERGTPLAEVLRSQAQDVRELGRRRLMESGGRKEIAMMVPVVFLVLPVTVLFAVYPGLVSLDLQL